MSPAAVRWSSIVERSHRSPLRLREFAQREGVNPNTLAWWRWRLKCGEDEPEPGVTGLAEVVLVDGCAPHGDEAPPARRAGLVVVVGAAKVEVDVFSDLQLLRNVVEVLA